MLVFDNNMLKLAKMHETLLKVSASNRQENLKKYKDIVIEIDKNAYSNFLKELEDINNHNHTLEEEVNVLEYIKDGYNQLSLLQSSFKNVCNLYGDSGFKLSDLSRIDIDYIEKRIKVINGYLNNLKDIDINEKKLRELSDKLILEEKNKKYFAKKLLDLEKILRDNFENAEGRIIVDGQLKYISVVSEYKDLGYEFKTLIDNKSLLEELLSNVNSQKVEIEEKMKAAEICYNSNPNSDSKQIFNDISNEFFRIIYKVAMLKILNLLSKDYDDFDLFKEKREKLLDLIKYRVVCLKNLGLRISIDPFSRTKIGEQIEEVLPLEDNSRTISRVKKEISLLSNSVEEMIDQNKKFKLEIEDVKDLIVSKTSMTDIIDIAGITNEDVEPVLIERNPVLDNQIVSIDSCSSKFNMSVVKQKTNSVIKRVNQMMNTVPKMVEKKCDVISPELVIVSQSSNLNDDDNKLNESYVESFLEINENEDNKQIESKNENVVNVVPIIYDSSMFENIDPFIETPFFSDRIDEEVKVDEPVTIEKAYDNYEDFGVAYEPKKEIPKVENVVEDNSLHLNLDSIMDNDLKNDVDDSQDDFLNEINEIADEMPDAFWVTQEEKNIDVNDDDDVLSFDEQINALLLDDDNSKIKKLVS